MAAIEVDLTSSSDEASEELIDVSDDDDDDVELDLSPGIAVTKQKNDAGPPKAIEDEHKEEPMEQEDDEIKFIREIRAPKADTHSVGNDVTNAHPLNNTTNGTTSTACVSNATANDKTNVSNIEKGSSLDAFNKKCLAELKKEAGNQQYKKKCYKKAVDLYTEAIDLCGPCVDCALFYSNRAAALIMLCKYRDAINDCKTCSHHRPDFGKVYQREGKCHLALGDIPNALRCFEEAKRLEPENTSIEFDIQSVQRVLKYESEAEKSYNGQDYRTVVFNMDRAIETCVSCAKFRLMKAESLAFLGRYQPAQEIANDLLQYDQMNVDAIYIRGMCLYYQDNIDKAHAHFQQALRLAPDHKKARLIYRKSKLLKGKKEQGNNAFKQHRYTEARSLYTEALAVDPLNSVVNSRLYCNRSAANGKLRKFDESIADATRAIEIDSTYVRAYLRRAKMYFDTEQFDESVRDYEKAFQLSKTRETKTLLHEARLELKKSKRKNYYKILGVAKDANDDEIKKAYRKRALLHHPDRHSGASSEEKKQHEHRFKEIGEAYAILSDVQKRRRYDTGQDMDGNGGPSPAEFDPNTIFQTFFGGGGGRGFQFNGGDGFTFHFG